MKVIPFPTRPDDDIDPSLQHAIDSDLFPRQLIIDTDRLLRISAMLFNPLPQDHLEPPQLSPELHVTALPSTG